AYEAIHPADALETHLDPDMHRGSLDQDAIRSPASHVVKHGAMKDDVRIARAQKGKPPLSQILNLKDMEVPDISQVNARIIDITNISGCGAHNSLITSPGILLVRRGRRSQ